MTAQTADWWDRLYADAADTATSPTSVPVPRSLTGTRSRLPAWWETKKDVRLDSQDEVEEDEDQEAEPEDATPEEPEEQPTGAESVTERQAGWLAPQAGYYPQPPSLPAAVRPALSAGTQKLLYNATAAAAGYFVGLTPQISDAIESCGREASIGAALILGGTVCLITAHLWDRKTRHWWFPLAWAARIPLMSAITALALYAPASQF
jgi:hypothetical protein